MPGIAAFGVTLTGVQAGAIGHIENLSGPGISVDMADVTSHDSPDRWEEAVPTVIRSGEVTFDINYDPSEHPSIGGLLNRLLTVGIDSWTMGGPIGAWSFEGYVTGFEPGAPHDDKLTAAVTIKPTGPVTAP